MTTFGEALQQARQLLGAGKYADARYIYVKLVEAAPEAADAWHELGITHLRAGDARAAVECLRCAVMLDDGNAAYHGNLGAAYQELKETSLARLSFKQALLLGKPTPLLYNNVALCLKDAGQCEAALATFDLALDLYGDYATAHFNKGNLLLELGRPVEAVASYQQAIRCQGNDAGAHCKLGMAHFELGELDEAVACFTRVLAIRPDYPEARRNRGFAWLAQGNFALGYPEFEWRTECQEFGNPRFEQPRWDGTPLDGRHPVGLYRTGTWRHVAFHSLPAVARGWRRSSVAARA